MKVLTSALTLAAVAAGLAPGAFAADHAKLDARLGSAKTVIDEVEGVPDKGIPQSILAGASCVIVIPGLKKGAFLVGGEYGKGVATCRTPNGWSAPVFLKLEGGSFGFQLGGQSTDLILVAMNKGGLDHLLSDKFKIGGDAAAAIGPVGRNAQASTDILLHAEFLTYSRSRGAFAGIDLNGAVLSQDSDDTRTIYGADVPYASVLQGNVPTPPEAKLFIRTVAKYFITASANQ